MTQGGRHPIQVEDSLRQGQGSYRNAGNSRQGARPRNGVVRRKSKRPLCKVGKRTSLSNQRELDQCLWLYATNTQLYWIN